MVYGYCRVSTPNQSIARQRRNILSEYPDAKIQVDYYTGTTLDRPGWDRLMKQLKTGDTVVFDEVNRMSRNADEGIEAYQKLLGDGIELVFLQQHYLDTAVYRRAADKIPLTHSPVDSIIRGVNEYLAYLVDEQIRVEFSQAEKEVQQLHRRTSEGIETARRAGKQIGRKPGTKVETKKAREAKRQIRKHSREFGGSLSDRELIKLCNISANSFYKYKRELKEELSGQQCLF